MAFTLPWVQKKQDAEEYLDARRHNSEEENNLIDEAQERWHIARSEKSDHRGKFLNDKWRELDKVYRGDQWKGHVPPHKSKPVLNFTFALVESVVPRITDNRPEVLVKARHDPMNQRLADMLTEVQTYLWYTNRMQKQMADAVRMCMKYGTVILKAIWEPDHHVTDVGEVVYSIVHPMNFYPDPRAYEVDQMDYCFVAVPRSLEYFVRRWPDKGHLVIADSEWADTENIEGADQTSQEQSAQLYEYWFKDEEGNVCVMYYAGHIVLDIIGGKYDESYEPVYRHNKFPFAKMVDYPADKEFWGIGEVELVTMLQRLINSFEAQIIDNTRLMANAEWVVNKVDSGLKEEDAWIFDNRPGNVIFTHRGGVDKIPGTPIPNHIPEHLDRLIFAMEQILGVHDVVQGQRPVGVRAASAIIALQESANVRVRQKAKNMEYALQDLADQANWLVLEFYDEPKSIRISGSDTPTTLNVREALDSYMVGQAAEEGLVMPETRPGELFPDELDEVHEELRFPEFDIEVAVGPSVPHSQALLYEQAKEFYQLGIIDRQAVLEITNFPNKEEILGRIEGQMQMAEAEEGGERVGERTFAEGGQGGPLPPGAGM